MFLTYLIGLAVPVMEVTVGHKLAVTRVLTEDVKRNPAEATVSVTCV
jgi:hypothetical protein